MIDGTETDTITGNNWGTMAIDNIVERNSSWWCSNGLYKKVYLDSSDNTAKVVVNSQQIIG